MIIIIDILTVSVAATHGWLYSSSQRSVCSVTPHVSHTIESCQIISSHESQVLGREWFTIRNMCPWRLGTGTYMYVWGVCVCEMCVGVWVYVCVCVWVWIYALHNETSLLWSPLKYTYITAIIMAPSMYSVCLDLCSRPPLYCWSAQWWPLQVWMSLSVDVHTMYIQYSRCILLYKKDKLGLTSVKGETHR